MSTVIATDANGITGEYPPVDTVVIVGHGLGPVGKKWGPAIDKHCVLRMKDPSWQWPPDYGTRKDYACASAETMLTMLDDKRIPKEYWVQPKKEQTYEAQEKAFAVRAQAPALILMELFKRWNYVFHLAQKELKREEVRNHSLGMFAITAAAELLKPKSIRLVGFDNLLDPEKDTYYKANRGKWVTQHDWFAERLMLEAVAGGTGVDIAAFS